MLQNCSTKMHWKNLPQKKHLNAISDVRWKKRSSFKEETGEIDI